MIASAELRCVVWTRRPTPEWRFLTCLADALHIRYDFRATRDANGASVVIADEADAATCDALSALPIPTLAFAGGGGNGEPCISTIRFNSAARIAWPFHGATMQTPLPGLRSIPISASADVVGTVDGTPLWTVSVACGARHHVFAGGRPELAEAEDLCDGCKGKRHGAALPLLYVMREALLALGWTPPPIRACFMFDDPNLHSSGYGFIDFDQVRRRGQEAGYHVSFATIPIDCWFVHRGAAALFRQHPQTLSLLVHGRDHTFRELARPHGGQAGCRTLLRQAVGRIQHFERVSGVRVARVMAAPHGACSEMMLREMGPAGFESACISPWSLRDHNPHAPWVSRLGPATSERIAGFPVIPRFRLSRSCEPQIRLAALLGQPIIPSGHHGDLSDGLDILTSLASVIRELGPVQWLNPEAITRSNVWVRRRGEELEVCAFSNRFDLNVDGATTRVRIRGAFWDAEEHSATIGTLQAGPQNVRQPLTAWLPVKAGPTTFVVRPLAEAADDSTPLSTSFRMWPVARRLVVEARDRLTPVLHRLRPTGRSVEL